MRAPKVVKEFLQRCIAPLQRHSRQMWAFAGHEDRMRLQEEDLAPEVLRKVLVVLTGDPSLGSLRHGAVLLYLCSGRADFVKQMPSFDEWGLHPAGLTGPRENPVVVVALLVAHDGPASGDGAGGRGSLGDEGSAVEMLTPRRALEAASPKACPGAAAGVELRPAAPEVEAPEAPAVPHEAAPGGVSQADASNATHLDASSGPQTNPCPKRLGRFRVDFEALRKRKEALGAMIAPVAY